MFVSKFCLLAENQKLTLIFLSYWYIWFKQSKKIRLNEIDKIKDYFSSAILKRKITSKKLSKYIAAFNYIDKTLTVLFETKGGVSIILFPSVFGAPSGIENGSFTPCLL